MRYFVGLLLGMALNSGAYASSLDDAALARTASYLKNLTTVQAHFTQDLISAQGKMLEHSEGVMSLARPGRFRWDYVKPASLIVSDGQMLWLYDPELAQVTQRKVSQTLSQTPALLLAGTAAVHDGYQVRDGGSAENLSWVVLTPKQASSDFSELRLGFTGNDLARMEFKSTLNQTTKILFQRIERNLHLDASLFSFTPPPGVDVVGPASAGSKP